MHVVHPGTLLHFSLSIVTRVHISSQNSLKTTSINPFSVDAVPVQCHPPAPNHKTCSNTTSLTQGMQPVGVKALRKLDRRGLEVAGAEHFRLGRLPRRTPAGDGA